MIQIIPDRRKITRKSSSPRDTLGYFSKRSGFPTDSEIEKRLENIKYEDKSYVIKLWKELYTFASSAGIGTSRQGKDTLTVFGDSTDTNIKFLDNLNTVGDSRFDALKEIYGNKITGDEIYLYIVQEKSDIGDIERIKGSDKMGHPCINKCKLKEGKCVCTREDTMESSDCNPSECGLSSRIWGWLS